MTYLKYNMLVKVLNGTQRAYESWKPGQNMITKISKLSNTRFSNIEGMMEATKKSILEENARLVRLRNEVMGEYKVMALIVNEIHAAIYHMQEVEALFYAISQLTRGKLSHQLVGVGAMRAKLRSVNKVLCC